MGKNLKKYSLLAASFILFSSIANAADTVVQTGMCGFDQDGYPEGNTKPDVPVFMWKIIVDSKGGGKRLEANVNGNQVVGYGKDGGFSSEEITVTPDEKGKQPFKSITLNEVSEMLFNDQVSITDKNKAKEAEREELLQIPSHKSDKKERYIVRIKDLIKIKRYDWREKHSAKQEWVLVFNKQKQLNLTYSKANLSCQVLHFPIPNPEGTELTDFSDNFDERKK